MNRNDKGKVGGGAAFSVPDFGGIANAIRKSNEHKKLEGRNLPAELRNKLGKLKSLLKEMDSVAVAFSGGVDSAFLLYVAYQVLEDKVLAVSAEASFVPGRESGEARGFCKELGIRQQICRVKETEIPHFCENPPDRCYLCKKEIFSNFCRMADEAGLRFVAEGSNMDDTGDYRPGMRSIAELGIRSPLKESGLYKSEIRELSRYFGLKTWDKPSYACLASRFVYGEPITREKLIMVDQAEQYLLDQGFHQMRVRMHGQLARIEVLAEEQEMLFRMRSEITETFRSYGFLYVTMDLMGFRSGSMNEVLKDRKETK